MNCLASLLGLLPANSTLEIEQVVIDAGAATLTVRTTEPTAACPRCKQRSDRVHSRYQRRLADLPWQGRTVALRVTARRFFCTRADCDQKIFVERLPDLAGVYARTTQRLAKGHGEIGLALGGEAGSRLAHVLAMPTSPDTLLRRVKLHPIEPAPTPRIVGVDDWAWRKGKRYGTILVDLERGTVLDLLPDREGSKLQTWLKERPQIEVISRDRSGTYAQAATAAAPQAKQVADRWHLLKNLREAVERIFDRCYGSIKGALAVLQPSTTEECAGSEEGVGTTEPEAPAIEPVPLSRRGQAQQVKHAHRAERFEQVHQLRQEGHSTRRIAATLGMARETVRAYLRREKCPDWQPGRTRPVRLDGFRRAIDEQLSAGCRNAAALHREVTSQGYTVSYHAVRRFVRRRLLSLGQPRQTDRATGVAPRPPSAKQLGFDFIRRPEERDADQQARLDAARAASVELDGALNLADELAAMLRRTTSEPLSAWLAKAAPSGFAEMRGFARSLSRDEAAVAAALTEDWSNGPVEGHVNRLKVIKRQMFGRAGFQLLRARVLRAA